MEVNCVVSVKGLGTEQGKLHFLIPQWEKDFSFFFLLAANEEDEKCIKEETKEEGEMKMDLGRERGHKKWGNWMEKGDGELLGGGGGSLAGRGHL